MGLKYERDLGNILLGAKHGQWIEFEDQNGRGYCQPDFLLRSGEALVLLECKYTWTEEAYRQMEGLYIPILQKLTSRKILGIQVCRNLLDQSSKMSKMARTLDEAILLAGQGRAHWHWLGVDSNSGILKAA